MSGTYSPELQAQRSHKRWGGVAGKRKRFLSRIDKNSDGCWEWTGAYGTTSPYGVCRDLSGKMTSAHRVAYQLFVDENFPKELYVLHRCDNPKCVNPKHLFLGTQQNNIDDMHSKNRSAKGKDLNHPSQVGEKNHGAKLTKDVVIQIRSMYSAGASCADISKNLGVPKPNVYAIVRRKSWKHLK